ncbi:MAG: hypothetical protein R3A10_01190 [Caldilineaceae bacterium]
MTVAVAHGASDDPASDPTLDPFADDPATSIPPLLDPVLVASVTPIGWPSSRAPSSNWT